MNKLYRYITIEQFLDIILTKELTFVHPSIWQDPFEVIQLDEKRIENSHDPILSITTVTKNFNLRAQSWTKLEESDALWKVYSNNNISLRICVDDNNFKKLKREMYVTPIVYEKAKIDLRHPFWKREAFKHENEYRVYFFSDKVQFPSQCEYSDLMKLMNTCTSPTLSEDSEDYLKKISNFNENKIEKVSFSHVDNFIESVLLNPLAPDYVNYTIELLCKNYYIPYLGKSTLYTK